MLSSSLEIFVYFDHVGANSDGHSFGFTSGASKTFPVNLGPEAKEHGSNAAYGFMKLDLTGQELSTVKIPLEFSVKEDKGTYWTFLINIFIFSDGEGREPGNFVDVITNTGYYEPSESTDTEGVEKLEGKVGTILQVITNIGIILAVIISAVIGVKYMLGSVEEKADFKKDLVPYLVGACLLFGTCTVVKILQGIGNNFNEQHSYGEIVIITSATCTTPGVGTRTCTGNGGLCNCSASKPTTINVTIPINEDAHDMGWVTIKEPTCMEEGLEAYECRRRCPYELSDDETRPIDKAEHAWDSGTVTEEATCGTKGEKIFTCTYINDEGEECTATKSEEISESGEHDLPEDGEVLLTATCLREGRMRVLCRNCHIYVEKTIPKEEHKLIEQISPAICNSPGQITYMCENCKRIIDTIEIPASHDYATKYTKLPMLDYHNAIDVCSRCGHTQNERIENCDGDPCVKCKQ